MVTHLDAGRDVEVHALLDQVKPGGSAPLATAISQLGRLQHEKKLRSGTVVVLFTGGENAGEKTPVQAYRDSKSTLPIHIFGFGIRPDSREANDLLELARVSAGSFRATEPAPPHALVMEPFRTRTGEYPIRVSAACHAARTFAVPLADVGLKPLDVALDYECRGKAQARRLLTITAKNVGDLAKASGLSPRARDMIQQRVKDGAWTVTMPSQRVNVAAVSAYAWFETETATGRVVGRTEDGLHGSIADPDNWPAFDPATVADLPNTAQQVPFVAWYKGIVAYTIGSVTAGLQWHRQPGFASGSADDLKRFIQTNALDASARWWDEVGSSSSPQLADYYWSGVCLNFSLQAVALGLPSDGCLRRWAENLCTRASDAMKAAGPEMGSEALNGVLEDTYGEERAALIRRGLDWGFADVANDVNRWWSEGVRQGFDCARVRAK